MEIKQRKIKDLKAADYNPRNISDTQITHLKKSLDKFQCVEPIVVNTHEGREDIIVGGHQRLKAMKQLGYKEVPTVEVCLSLKEEKELNVRLNKNTGEFDFSLLEQEFEIDDLLEWGFEDDELNFEVEEVNLPDLPTGDKEPFQQITFTLHDEQAEIINEAIKEYKATDGFKYMETFGNENSNGNALYGMVQEWLVQKK